MKPDPVHLACVLALATVTVATASSAVSQQAQAGRPAPLTGHVSRATLEAFPGWADPQARDYTPDPATVSSIAERIRDVDALLFVATWCPDSRREVPRLFTILDQARFPESRLTLHALDRSKKDAAGLTEKWKIERVPTFVFLRGGREIGRIVERPAATLEADLLAILR